MGDKYILDCTLRDGGYLNDWNFGHDNLVSIFERVTDANIDFIEVGFLDDRMEFDVNRSIMPDSDSVNRIYGDLDKKNTKVIGMIDYGTCSINNITEKKYSYLDGIRVIFKKHLRREALEYCTRLKELGYMVFAQLVSVTSYTDEELMDLIRLANEVKPYAVSMVDTYGLMHQNNLSHYFKLLDRYLDSEINLGYHGHNNFQMGYANCISMLSNETNRKLIVDGSIYGMGKSAGNAPLELVAMHMNRVFNKNYDISQILEAIDSNISQFYTPASWGYNMYFYLAALNDCHPNYVGYLMDKKTLSIKSINEILSKLNDNNKLLYDKQYIESLYLNYQKNEVNDDNDYRRLSIEISNIPILVLGPGKTAIEEKDIISAYINDNNPIVISINYISSYKNDYLFLTNSKRYVQLASKLSKKSNLKIISTSNITKTGNYDFDYVLNYGLLIDPETEIIDNSLAMLIKVLIKLNCKEIVLAGFDGYSSQDKNYIDDIMEYDFIKQKYNYLNTYISEFIKKNREYIDIKFLTNTLYEL